MNLRFLQQPASLAAMAVVLSACNTTVPAAGEQPSASGRTAGVTIHASSESPQRRAVKVVELKTLPDLDAIVPLLAKKRVVFVGETHDHYQDHLAQLEVIRGLHARRPNLAIGVEYFQVPFQQALDAYIAGQSSEKQLLRKTEYFERWRFDYRLYRPIMQYARAQGIPVIALNIPTEISRKVARSGIDSLSESEKAQIPQEIDRSDTAYRERLRAVFDAHKEQAAAPGSFDDFVEAQLLWDEAMAKTAATYLQRHPHRPMVILAGNGHLLYGSGIPHRLLRRIQVKSAIVLNADGIDDPDMADFLLLPPSASLPPAGMLGVFLRQQAQELVINGLTVGGPAMRAGLKKDDVLLAIDGEHIATLTDVKLALLDKLAGERVNVRFRRVQSDRGAKIMDVEVVLAAMH
jgi:uncharacterized iron-regulated protein